MNWQEVCEHPELKNLPFKIELNENGQIIMSPSKIKHAAFQGEIAGLIKMLSKTGKVLTECAIETRNGTKVADAAWISDERFEKIKSESASSIAPEICIEILSENNTEDEMAEKRELYFENSALEVWICSLEGDMYFYKRSAELPVSKLITNFPKKIEL